MNNIGEKFFKKHKIWRKEKPETFLLIKVCWLQTKHMLKIFQIAIFCVSLLIAYSNMLKYIINTQNTYLIQLLTFAYLRLINKPYENEVTLTGQNPPLKYC